MLLAPPALGVADGPRAHIVNDGTGRVSVHRYLDGDASAEQVGVGQYVRVFGHVRDWQGQTGVNAHKVCPVLEAVGDAAVHSHGADWQGPGLRTGGRRKAVRAGPQGPAG